MKIIKFHSTEPITLAFKDVLKVATKRVFGTTPVQFVPADPAPDVLCFGSEGDLCTLPPSRILSYPFPENYLISALRRVPGELEAFLPWTDDANRILFLDSETHSVADRWKMPPREFFRLGQYAWGLTGSVITTTDYDEIVQVVRSAAGVIAHNAHAFDISVMFGTDSVEPLQMAVNSRVFDTMVYAASVFPAPETYVARSGVVRHNGALPDNARKWFSLDNLCFQLGLSGKEGDLKSLADFYGGYGLIPVDDPDFLRYAVQDVVALQELTFALLAAKTPTRYDWREQLNAAIDAQNSRNGFKVDIPRAQARVQELSDRKEVILADLQSKYGLPTEGKSPWATTVGKAAIMSALSDYDITPENTPQWKQTATGSISLGGDTLIDITTDTPAADLGHALAELKGQRSLANLALDCVQPDGLVHPEITALQRSARKSTTHPGLTIWTSRGEGAVEKSYFIAGENEKLIEYDFSQADARIVAAYSGDEKFKERFAPGSDAHEITGRVVFEDEYDTDPVKYRYIAKNLGHAYAYRAAVKKLTSMSGQPVEVVQRFVDKMEEAYTKVTQWQNRVAKLGKRGFITNDWGRTIVIDPAHAYTQAPAMYGQSGTRELMVDALIRMLYYDIRIITWLKAQIHDALVFSIPEDELEWAVPKIKELMECDWAPSDGSGQRVHFSVSVGPIADNWMECGHG